ncbi:MAG: DUF3576 domain-containing protein [Bdellovibrionales bacterium]
MGLQSDPSYSNKSRDSLYKDGSLVSDGGGVSLFGGADAKSSVGTGLGVNGFLWRATLDTVSFMPLVSADPFGGVILTDWHSAAATPDERTKLNIIIMGRELRADGVKVSVFRQIRSSDGSWGDAPASASTASAIENAILAKARQLRTSAKP